MVGFNGWVGSLQRGVNDKTQIWNKKKEKQQEFKTQTNIKTGNFPPAASPS